MEAQNKVDAFVEDLRDVIKKHYGTLPEGEVEPFGMSLRQTLPVVSFGDGSVTTTTTGTVYPSLDSDPPDSDD